MIKKTDEMMYNNLIDDNAEYSITFIVDTFFLCLKKNKEKVRSGRERKRKKFFKHY